MRDALLPGSFGIGCRYVASRPNLISIYGCVPVGDEEVTLSSTVMSGSQQSMSQGSDASNEAQTLVTIGTQQEIPVHKDKVDAQLLKDAEAGRPLSNYRFVEATVLPFILRYIFDANQEFITASNQSLLIIAILAELCWCHVYGERESVEDAELDSLDVGPKHRPSFAPFLRRTTAELHRIGVINDSFRTALWSTWEEMCEKTDILMVSSVLFMPTFRKPTEW